VKLMVKCRFNWNVLEGSHHRYLEAPSGRDTVVPGIWVLTAKDLMWLAGALSSFAEEQSSSLKQQFFQWVHDEVYWLCVDPALPPLKSPSKSFAPSSRSMARRHEPS
jgi:hypothetical protein